jgi:hypothetical protein
VIVESGTSAEQPYVVLGDCQIDGLPPNLPEGSKIDVTISYDQEAKVHVSAKDAASGKSAHTEILRQENIVAQLASDPRVGASDSVVLADEKVANPFKKPATAAPNAPGAGLSSDKWEAFFDQTPSKPIPLCAECGRPLDEHRTCPHCAAAAQAQGKSPRQKAPPTTEMPAATAERIANRVPPPIPKAPAAKPPASKAPAAKPPVVKPVAPKPPAQKSSAPNTAAPGAPASSSSIPKPPVPKPAAKPATAEIVKTPPAQSPRKPPTPERPQRKPSAGPRDEGEDEFWKYVGE